MAIVHHIPLFRRVQHDPEDMDIYDNLPYYNNGSNNGANGPHDLHDMEDLLDEMETFRIEQENIKNEQKSIIAQIQDLENGSLTEKFSKAYKQHLVFKHDEILSDDVWRGDVKICFDNICKELPRDPAFGYNTYDCGQLQYFGATSNPEERIKAHIKNDNNILGLKMNMRILYATHKLENAAEMETRLIKRYSPISKNIKQVSSGLPYGKPSYFVYMLRYGRKVIRK